ncbi:hypothetical protein GCM10023232_00370 [Sphingosinicella ginsenosidimutans]|uniref:DUF2793 domain-containing protein n=1 Tax=Allosphingosinicella ginsenosidimutans TaxID=1176539 RepID=A0A5C6TW51_9SPHN|nr:DUF2793 domain-containing protein [Sphingosinicella ginsenosidimutans]TXC63948.1 DUF2793 domain-containing protein [Sphingosinicella ginsenosidimutans]
MSDASPRFSLPFLLPGQAQKEMFHNEALLTLDSIVHPVVEDGPSAAPPSAPAEGETWIVAGGATGAWAGQEDAIATWSAGGWRFTAPLPGLLAWNRAAGLWLHWDGANWSDGRLPAAALVIDGDQVVGPRQPAIASPSGGTTIDAEARSAIDALIATLMSHGLIE